MSDKRKLGESVPESEWRRFHKVTPIAKGGLLWIFVAIVLFNFLQNFLEEGLDTFREFVGAITVYIILVAVGILAALTAIVIAFSWVAWRFQSYAVVNSGIHKRTGVVFKNHTQMRWDRIQSVEVEQRLFGRIFGFGSVKVESAGNEPGIELGLLTMADCATLRREILQSLANARAGLPIGLDRADVPEDVVEEVLAEGKHSSATEGAGAASGKATRPAEIPVFDPDDTENDQLIFELPTSRLIGSRLLSFAAIGSALLVVAMGFFWFTLGEASIAFLILAFGALFSFIKSMFDQYGTKVYLSENGLRVRSGLTKLTTRTIPPARLHAIEINRPLLWRWKDWWQVSAILASNDIVESSGDAVGAELIIPAGSREEALRLLWIMLPDAGTDDDAALICDALDGFGTGRFFLSSPKRAKWFDPITYSSRGICLTPKVAVFRRGRFARRVMFVWQDHTQSMRMSQGPIQRRFGLGEITLEMVKLSSATHKNMAIDEVEHMIWVENELAARARHVGISESVEEWRERVRV